MLKSKRIFLVLLSTFVLFGFSYIPASAATTNNIIGGSVFTQAGTYYSTDVFPLNTDKLQYGFWRYTYGSYSTDIYLQVYKNSQWNTIRYASTSGSDTARGVFSNLEVGLYYRVLLSTNDPNSRMTSLYLDEVYD